MTDTPDNLIDAAVADARTTLPVFVVAETPAGQALSYNSGFPGDDTEVWIEGGDPTVTTPLSDLYAQYGQDVIVYAEPEAVSGALVGTPGEALPPLDPADYADNAQPIPTELVDQAATVADTAAPVPAALPADEAGTVEPTAVRAALINQAGVSSIDEIEAFLDEVETVVAAAVVASLPADTTIEPRQGVGAVSLTTMRKAVGGNDTAQADIVAAFTEHYDPDVNKFVWAVLGERPGPDANHDAEAWDATDKEARLWHAKQAGRAVVASMGTVTPAEREQRRKAAAASAAKRRSRHPAKPNKTTQRFFDILSKERRAATAEGRDMQLMVDATKFDATIEKLNKTDATVTPATGETGSSNAVKVTMKDGTVLILRKKGT